MIKIYHRLLYEPAIFIGFLLSLLAFVFKVANSQEITYDDFVVILSPLATGALVRPKTISKRYARNSKQDEDI